ncbi:MAG: flavodoxin domain-containing protein [Thomasclavelia sp.]|uniref:flavodoxin domain-containing protein n=1 Tax=Thomasclavelia sp. TaxID=3025757 RepID=UPI0039A3A505
MKITIVYGSKYGSTENLANYFGEILSAEVYRANESIDIHDSDIIILGSSVYAGTLNKSLKLWVSTHQKELLDKQVFIFLCGLQIEEGNKVIQNNLGKEFFSTLCYVDCLGGVIDYSKMNFIEKKIINMINKKVHMFAYDKQIGVYNMLQENRIQSFIQKIYDN